MAEMHSELDFHCLAKHVCTRMPESLSSFIVFKVEELEFAISFKRTRCIVPFESIFWINLLLFFGWNWSVNSFVSVHNFAIGVPDLRHNQTLGLFFVNHLCNVEGISLERYTVVLLAINSDFDWVSWKILVHLLLGLIQCSELIISSLQELWALAECPFSTNLLLLFSVSALLSSFLGTLIFFSLLRFSLRCFLVLTHLRNFVSINFTLSGNFLS